MTQERIKITKYIDYPDWERLEINNKWSKWTIEDYNDGTIGIECDGDDQTNTLCLTQDELKQVIEFLQSKIIK